MGEEKMLICMKCHIEYEEGMEFCPQCGGPLVTKEKPVSGHEDTNEKEEAKSKERLICPNCKILYERMQSCVRCGAALVKQIPSQEKEKLKPSDAPGDKERESQATGAPKDKKELPPSQPAVTRKEPESLDVSETKKDVRKELASSQPREKQPARKLPEDVEMGFGLPSQAKKNFFQTPVGLLGTLAFVAVAIYLLFSLYSYFTKKVSEPGPSGPGETGQIASPGTSTPTDQTTTVTKSSSPRATAKLTAEEKEEMEKIEGLLDKIRLANLLKDIDLFMSCYSDEFENLEGRRKMALETWRNFDYNDLSYNLKDHSISGNIAKARVEWLMKISAITGGKPEETKTALDVVFKKERGDWKVKEIIHLR